MFGVSRFWPKMASNRNRFIPYNWLRAAQANAAMAFPSYYNHYDFTSDGIWWPPTNHGYYPGYNGQVHTTGAYQTFANVQKSSTKKTPRKREDEASRSKISKKGLQSKFHQEDSHNHATQTANKGQPTFRNTKEENRNRPLWDFTQTTNAKEYCPGHFQPPRGLHSAHYHSWGRYNERHISKKKHAIKKNFGGPSTSATTSLPCQKHTASGTSTSMESDITDEDESRYQLERVWEDLESPGDIKMDGIIKKKVIRVVSYNILSQKLLNLNSSLYRKCNPDILLWGYRWPKLKEEIRKFDADVLCLQEVEESHYKEEILDFLEHQQYHCHYKKRTGDNPNKPDGVVIAFKKHQFQMVAVQRVEYFRGDFSPVNQDNVALITLLRPLFHDSDVQSSCICFVNTHLLYNPKRGDIKLVQLSTLFSEIHSAIARHTNANTPIVLCGDFNSTPRSHIFDFITKQEIEYEGIEAKHVSGQKVSSRGKTYTLPTPLLPNCLKVSTNGCVKKDRDGAPKEKPRHDATAAENETPQDHCLLKHSVGPLVSAHSHLKEEASTTQDKGITVDYIFYTPHKEKDSHLTLYPTKRLALICPDDLRRVRGIPNAAHPSDHLPIICDFALFRH